jgi:hypothetical protein
MNIESQNISHSRSLIQEAMDVLKGFADGTIPEARSRLIAQRGYNNLFNATQLLGPILKELESQNQIERNV